MNALARSPRRACALQALCASAVALVAQVALVALAGCTSGEPERFAQVGQAICGHGGCCTLAGRVDATTSPDGLYYLTSFGGGGFGAGCGYDTQPVACGGRQADGCWYYAAGRQRWPCHTRLRLTRPEDPTRCVVVEVVDTGPDECVETAAGRRVIDASPVVAHALFGRSCAGFSDYLSIRAEVVPSTTPNGPCGQRGECASAPPAARPGSGVGLWNCSTDRTARARCVNNEDLECEPCGSRCEVTATGMNDVCIAGPADAGPRDAAPLDGAPARDADVPRDAGGGPGLDGALDAGADDAATPDAGPIGTADARASGADAGGEYDTAQPGCACRARATDRGARGGLPWVLASIAALALRASRRRRRASER